MTTRDPLADPDGGTVYVSVADRSKMGSCETTSSPLEVSVGHHVPCHIKALQGPVAGPDLLRVDSEDARSLLSMLVAPAWQEHFGFKSKNYDVSLPPGEAMLQQLRQPRHLFGSAECSSCRMQMEDGANKRSLHPIQYLALSYGLNTESDAGSSCRRRLPFASGNCCTRRSPNK